MDTEALQLAEQAFSDVLERFAFMFSDPVPAQDMKSVETDFCKATIGFTGPRSGVLTIVASSEIGEKLAANILGMEPRMINREAGEDSFKEVLNVTCGEFLEQLAGPDVIFDLTVPRLERLPASAWAALAKAPMTRGLMVEDTSMLVHLEISDP